MDYLVLNWKRNSYDSAASTNNITVNLQIYSTAGYPAWNLNGNTTRLRVGGDSATYNKVNDTNSSLDFRNTSQANPRTIATWTGTVQADSAGNVTVPIYGYIYYNDSESSHMAPGAHNISLSAVIDQIPRASNPSAPAGSFGSALTISTNRASSSFTHTIVCSMGSHSQTITGVGASTSFTVPASWADTIPTATSNTLTIKCTTYSGSTQIGSQQTATCTISVPSTWKPAITVSKSVTRPDGSGNPIKSVSTVSMTASATASTGTSISSYSWTGSDLSTTASASATTGTISTTGSLSWTVTVTDRRGRSNTATITASAVSGISSFTCDTSVDFGASHTVTITRKNSNITHTVKREIGSNYNNQTGVAETNTLTIPTSWASNASSSVSVSMTVTVTSFYGSTNLGDSSRTVTVNVPASWVPSIGNPTATGVDEYLGSLLKLRSRVTIAVADGVPSEGATIASYKFSGNALNQTVETAAVSASATSTVFTDTGTLEYTVTITDSRGRTASKTVSVTVQNYAKPTLMLTAHRCDVNGNADDNGDYCETTITGTWDSTIASNAWSLKLEYRINGSGGAYTTQFNITGQTGTISRTDIFAADVNYAFELVATVTDAVGTVVTSAMILSTAKTIMAFYKDALVTFGKPATAQLLSDLGDPEFASYFENETWFAGAMKGRAEDKNSFPVYILPEVQKNTDLGGASTTAEYYQKLLKWICEKYPNVKHGIWTGTASPSSVDDVSIHIYDTSAVDSNGYPQYGSVQVTRYNGEMYVYGFDNYIFYERQIGNDAIRWNATISASTHSVPVNFPSGGATIGGQVIPGYSKGWLITASGNDAILIVVDVNGYMYTAYRNNGTWNNGSKHPKMRYGSSTQSFKAAAGVTSAQTAAGAADIAHGSYSSYANRFATVTSGAVWGVLCMGANATYHSMMIFTYNESRIWKFDYRNGTYNYCEIDFGTF